jgi:ABC-type lipoprotein release transport system permease subunit
LAAALAGGRVVESLLYGVTARDPIVLTIAPLALVAAAALACTMPALRASQVDPAIVLREE